MSDATVILQMICPDRPGLVSELAGWVAANGGSIRHADHHTDAGAGVFLSRIEWQLQGFGIPRDVLPEAAQSLGQRLGGEAQLHFSDDHPRVALFASKQRTVDPFGLPFPPQHWVVFFYLPNQIRLQ